ncbi:MAG: hypothetical protein QM820_46465 [Minicystis sp.]
MNFRLSLVVTALSALGAVFAAGCGGDDCTRADDHYAECVASDTSSSSSGMAAAQVCSGARLCQSQCINNHTCTQITGNDPDYKNCLAACLGK